MQTDGISSVSTRILCKRALPDTAEQRWGCGRGTKISKLPFNAPCILGNFAQKASKQVNTNHIAITWQSHSSSSMRLDKERRQCRFAKVENARHDGEELWYVFWCDCLTKCQSCIFTLTQPSLGFRENGPNKWKYPVSSSCLVENDLFLSGVRYPTLKPINSHWLHYYYPVVPRCT